MRRAWITALASIVVFLLAADAVSAGDSRPYVALESGWIDKHQTYGWALFAERPGPPEGTGPHGAQRPCLSVAAVRRYSDSLGVRESHLCYGLPHYLSAKAEPLLVTNTVFESEKGSAIAIGVAASPAARALELTLDSGSRTVRLRALNGFQARKTRLRPFRYAGFVMRGDLCIEQIVVLNEAGNTLWDSGSAACPPVEAAARWQP